MYMEQEEDALIYGLQMINGHNSRENRTPNGVLFSLALHLIYNVIKGMQLSNYG